MQPRPFDPLKSPLISQYVCLLAFFVCIAQICIFDEMHNGVQVALAAKLQESMPNSLLWICS